MLNTENVAMVDLGRVEVFQVHIPNVDSFVFHSHCIVLNQPPCSNISVIKCIRTISTRREVIYNPLMGT